MYGGRQLGLGEFERLFLFLGTPFTLVLMVLRLTGATCLILPVLAWTGNRLPVFAATGVSTPSISSQTPSVRPAVPGNARRYATVMSHPLLCYLCMCILRGKAEYGVKE
jgi:hypothetical protein